MGRASWQPTWWTADKHETAWDRVKEALKRDWEQTKSDLHAGGRDLNQDVDDTVKQAAGAAQMPAPGQQTKPDHDRALGWDDAEEPLRFGVGARHHYGAQHTAWDDKVEGTLRSEWESGKPSTAWEQVRGLVRRGYERT